MKPLRLAIGVVSLVMMFGCFVLKEHGAAADWGIVAALIVGSMIEHP